MKVKPKRPARKRKLKCVVDFKWLANLRAKIEVAEAGKRILREENSRLRDANQDRVILFEEVTRQKLMLDALCRALEHTQSYGHYATGISQVNSATVIRLVAERDALAKRNEKQAQVIEELEAENYAHKKNRTLSMMQVEKW